MSNDFRKMINIIESVVLDPALEKKAELVHKHRTTGVNFKTFTSLMNEMSGWEIGRVKKDFDDPETGAGIVWKMVRNEAKKAGIRDFYGANFRAAPTDSAPGNQFFATLGNYMKHDDKLATNSSANRAIMLEVFKNFKSNKVINFKFDRFGTGKVRKEYSTQYEELEGFFFTVDGYRDTVADIIAPNGEQWQSTGYGPLEQWLFDETDFYQTLATILNYSSRWVPGESDAPKERQAVGNQVLGTCAICGRRQVVSNGKMHKHGYQRPGYGFLVGICFGAGKDPIEISPDAMIQYVPILERHSQDLVKRTASLTHDRNLKVEDWKAGEDFIIPATHADSNMHVPRAIRNDVINQRDFSKYNEDMMFSLYSQSTNSKLTLLKFEVANVNEYLVLYKKNIAAWKPGKLITTQED
mgnify:FL=1